MGIFSKLFGGQKDQTENKTQVNAVEKTSADDMPENVTLLAAEQIQHFTTWVEHAPGFLEDHGVELTDDELGCYDEAFKRWHECGDLTEEGELVVSCLGSYFGDKLIRDFSMHWVVVKDSSGEDFGVRHSELEMILFPFDSIIKRIESGEYGFMSAIYNAVEERLNEGGIAAR